MKLNIINIYKTLRIIENCILKVGYYELLTKEKLDDNVIFLCIWRVSDLVFHTKNRLSWHTINKKHRSHTQIFLSFESVLDNNNKVRCFFLKLLSVVQGKSNILAWYLKSFLFWSYWHFHSDFLSHLPCILSHMRLYGGIYSMCCQAATTIAQ